MAKFRQIIAALSGLVLGMGLQSQADSAKVSQKDVELACQRALEANTVEALEEFFHNYPPEKYRDAACYSLALAAINNVVPPKSNFGGNRDEGGGYGG